MSTSTTRNAPRDDGRRMTPDERAAFLARGITCRLACLDDDGHPYVIPVWHQYQAGGFYVIARERSAWARYLRRDPRVSLCIDAPPDEPNARVLVKGVAEIVEEPNVGGAWQAIARAMSIRYSGAERGLAYFEKTRAEPRWLILIRPQKITDWVGGWAARYKHADW